jgi:hypothetical protein
LALNRNTLILGLIYIIVIVHNGVFYLDNKRLNSNLDKKLREFIKTDCSYVEDFDYHVKSETNEIVLKGVSSFENTDIVLENIKNIEKILNAKYQEYMILNGVEKLIFKFNE